ncbi:hypothetical protein, partial [Enterobacter asburiae]|uniref:hypothetical protein n=1 Tax=Enterobacter asburiae TaxID=61645 RepID=UPI0021D0F5DB
MDPDQKCDNSNNSNSNNRINTNHDISSGTHTTGRQSRSTHRGLWGVWLTWGLALVLWVSEGNG